jgi:hypothetical protein
VTTYLQYVFDDRLRTRLQFPAIHRMDARSAVEPHAFVFLDSLI